MKTEFKILEAEYNGKKFRIEEDYPEVGTYLYVYENGNCTEDYLQDNIEVCKQLAHENYKVPFDRWVLKEG